MSAARPPPARRGRRVAAAAVAVAAVVSVLAPVGAAGADGCLRREASTAPIERVAGPDRFATAACASSVAYPDGAGHVLLARGDPAGGLADALAGAVLATAVRGPVLLALPDALPSATRDELARLAPDTVTILGGPRAVSPAVEQEVAALGARTRRVAGSGRAATAAAVARDAGAGGTAFVVNGFRPADSLVAAAPAARRDAALLLTGRTGLPAATSDAVDGLQRVVIVGGHGVVSAGVEDELRRLVGADAVRRVAGADRAATAASVARAFPAAGTRQIVAQADGHLVDAVTAGWTAALSGGPVLYASADGIPRPTDRFLRLGGLEAADGGQETTRLVGGSGVLTPALVGALERRYEDARTGGPPPELRGMWVHLFDPSLKSREGIAAVLNAAARANLNTVVVQVARRQDAYYRSTVLPRTADPDLPADLDVLAELVPAAHDRGLAVHAWVSTLPAYHPTYEGLQLGPDHVWVRHGPSSSDPWTTRAHDGAVSTFLDPAVPGVQEHVAGVLAEIAGRYAVDAVHVDYLRYEGAAWGYHPTALERYRAETGAAGVPAPADPSWQAWRRRQTHDLARRIFLEVRAADPQVAVSLAASTMGAGPAGSGGYPQTRTYQDVLQDWPAWLAEGLVDAAIPMNYFREHDPAQRSWFDDWVAFEAALPRGGRPLAVGQASYLNSVDGSRAQLDRARAATDGVVLYSYQQGAADGPRSALLDALAGSLFAVPAPAPALVPAGGRATGSPDAGAQGLGQEGHVLVRAADGAMVTAQPADGGPVARRMRADATGHAGFVDLPPGRWTLRADGYAPETVTVRTGEVERVTLPRS